MLARFEVWQGTGIDGRACGVMSGVNYGMEDELKFFDFCNTFSYAWFALVCS